MASAILPTRNNPQSNNFIPKFDHNTLNLTRLQKNPTRNPNPNPRYPNFVNQQPLTSSPPPKPSGYRYITFRIDTYTKTELKGLKKRLISDLQRVRILRQFVCSTPVPKTTPSGLKRPKTTTFGREVKKACGTGSGRVTIAQKRKLVMRECSQILGKLMKHKHGWVFNTPVDAAAMKLYDYHNVIRKPMDLGTVRSKIVKNEYDSPLAFASDVRLTFENAMVYNGKGSDVFVMAEGLLLLFEDLFGLVKFENPKTVVNQSKLRNVAVVVGAPVVCKKMSVDKREMTVEEKAELASSLLNLKLRPEGMDQIMGIVKKGAGLEREGDEIELDLAVLDNETLWELHSFIGRARKEAAVTCNNMISSVQTDNCRERDAGEEDVDIGEEEMELTDFPSVVIEKDVVNGSGSSGASSSDSDTSSSDSGLGTSCNEHEVNSIPKGVVQ